MFLPLQRPGSPKIGLDPHWIPIGSPPGSPPFHAGGGAPNADLGPFRVALRVFTPTCQILPTYLTVCYRQLGNLVQFEKSPLPAPGGTVSGDLAGEPDRIPCFVRAIQALGGGGGEELSISVQTWGSGGDPLGIQRGSGTFWGDPCFWNLQKHCISEGILWNQFTFI